MWRLALDMGTSSLGWAALSLTKPKSDKDKPKVSKILDMGVRIFPDGREAKTGTPLNEARRNARQVRRQGDRKIRHGSYNLLNLVESRK